MSESKSKCRVCFTTEPIHFYKHHRSLCKHHYCEAKREERSDPALREALAYKAKLYRATRKEEIALKTKLRRQRKKEAALAGRTQA